MASSLIDADPTNDTASDTTTVLELSTLTVTKDDGLASVVAGDGLGHAYTITVANSGPSDADSVVVDDVVPGAMTAAAPAADLGGDCTASLGNTIHCTLPASLAVGATWTITIPYTVGPAATPGIVTNGATAASAENPLGVTGSDVTEVIGSADLAVSVSDGLASVVAGDGLTHGYTITVSNGGPSDATSVSLTDSWPTGFAQGAITPSQGSCAPIGAGPDFGCALGTIAAGASATVSVAYTVPATTDSGVQTDTASVASSLIDADPTNDTASDTTTVLELSTLTVTKDDGLASVVAGDGLGHAYTITVANSGPSDADSVVVDDVVPGAMTAAAPAADLGGDCTASLGNTIHCTLPASLAVGATWTITIPYTVGPAATPGIVTNGATAASAENPLGVTGSDVTEVLPPRPGGGSAPDTDMFLPDGPLFPATVAFALMLALASITALFAVRRDRP